MTAFIRTVGELWQDLPTNEKTSYLAALAHQQVTKSHGNLEQDAAELRGKDTVRIPGDCGPRFLEFEGSWRSHSQELPEESSARKAATGTAPQMHGGTSSIEIPYVLIPKDSMSLESISRSAAVGRRSITAPRERCQAGVFLTPAEDGIESAFKDPETDSVFQRITEVSDENDSASNVNQSTKAPSEPWMPSNYSPASNASDTAIDDTATDRVTTSAHVRAKMNLIMSEVVHGFSSRAPKASLLMPWDLLAFMDTQYVDNKDAHLASVITLSGTAQYAQATTCSEYAEQNWPSRGLRVIQAFQSAVDNSKSTSQGW